MKYRRLSEEELHEMEKEFVQYLVSNGIDAPEWKQIQKTKKSEEWIIGFSDAVLHKVLEGIEYLEFRSAHEARFFNCSSEDMRMIAMTSTDVDLTKPEEVVLAMQDPGKIELYQGSKRYIKARELELFEMTETGCVISDGKLFDLLKEMV
jgi:hypothetical protein